LTTQPASKFGEFFSRYGNREARAAEGFSGFSAKTTNDVLEIRIYDIIESSSFWGGISPAAVADALKESSAKSVLVRFNSPGGDAFSGIAIYNILAGEKRPVRAVVDGLAASAASIAAMGANELSMATGSMLMIHKAWLFMAGNSDALRSQASVLDSLDSNMAGIYAKKSGMSTERAMEFMTAETYFTASEARANGLVNAEENEDGTGNASRALAIAVDFNKVFSAERGQFTSKQGETMSDIKAFAALEAKNEALNSELSGLKAELSGVKAKHEATVKALADEADKQRSRYEELATKAAKSEQKLIEQDVDSLIGKKITADERDTFVKLACSDRDLFDQMVAKRPALALTERIIKEEPKVLASSVNQSGQSTGDSFAEAIEN
jgi:ATP-dependent protease ClpP protease subunit